MAVVEIESRYVLGVALGASANRTLALRCWQRVRERMSQLGVRLEEQIVHHDQDSVYTSYDWLRALLVEDGLRVSYSERGARGNPWIESLWGRLKVEIGSRLTEAQGPSELLGILTERFARYNQSRRHSSIGYVAPSTYLHQTHDALKPKPLTPAAT